MDINLDITPIKKAFILQKLPNRYWFSLLAIMNVILRIQNLRTHLPEEQVMAEISSYNFLHRIRNLLCTTDYLELSRDLVANGLDARVASGPDALRITLNRMKTTIAVLEPVVEKLKAKPRVKSAHVVDSEDREDTGQFVSTLDTN